MRWTREHDKAIADKCEGLHVEWHKSVFTGAEGWCFSGPADFGSGIQWRPVWCYDQDITVVIHAAEAWKRQESMENTRSWSIQSGGTPKGVPIAILVDVVIPANSWAESRAEPCAALAWALYHAVSPAPAQGGGR